MVTTLVHGCPNPVGVSSPRKVVPSSTFGDLLHARADHYTQFPSRAPSDQVVPAEFGKLQTMNLLPLSYCNRPAAASSTPVALMHPIFGRFVDECNNYTPTEEDNAFIANLSKCMSGFFEDERKRRDAFIDLFRQYGVKECQSTAQSEGHRFWCSAKEGDEEAARPVDQKTATTNPEVAVAGDSSEEPPSGVTMTTGGTVTAQVERSAEPERERHVRERALATIAAGVEVTQAVRVAAFRNAHNANAVTTPQGCTPRPTGMVRLQIDPCSHHLSSHFQVWPHLSRVPSFFLQALGVLAILLWFPEFLD